MEYIKARGIRYANELPTIRKKKNTPLQPVFEAFTNAWEAIREKYTDEHINLGCITLELYCISNALSETNGIYDFEKLCIRDNGIGLNDESYERLVTLRDNSKHFSNKGTGRIQYIHTFDETILESVFKRNDNSYWMRKVTLSKKDAFISQNAIMRLDEEKEVPSESTNTIVTFLRPLESGDIDYFQALNIDILKEELLKHFLSLFCDNRAILPHIKIVCYKNQNAEKKLEIKTEDIPEPNKEETFTISYSQLGENNRIVHSLKKEEFTLKSFVQPDTNLKENAIYLVSKGERASSIKLENLAATDSIAGNRYLFLLSSPYIDNHDRDDRGNIVLISAKDFRAQEEGSLFPEETILLDDIVEETNNNINRLYNELDSKNQEKNKTIDELQQMFLLNPCTVDKIRRKIKNTDSEETILKAIYQADSEIEAQKDDAIRKQLEEIKTITPDKTDDYSTKIQEKVDELITSIPLQNRTVLSKYIARRKIVLDLFDEILNRELESLKNGKRIDEKLLHNLLFQQGKYSENPDDSDLWIINEEFIYFRGVSEERFEDIEYQGKKIFEKEFSEEDKRYLNSLGERRLTKRPDVLLFPEENKAIIIEFKAPDVNVSEHLSQIDFYANILLNYTREDLQLTTFYGYLIGEGIEDRDVRGRVSRYEYSPKFHYWFRPSEKVINFNNGPEGNIYTEVIKYSTLLERAKFRNQIFIEKLVNGESKKSKAQDL